MEKICKLSCLGSCAVGANWKCTVQFNINRMYYINGGKGGYIEDGKKVPFEHGMMYFIPYYSGASTYAEPGDKVDHTYASFTLYPPIVSSKIIRFDPDASPLVRTAVDTFRIFCEKLTLNDTESDFLKSILIYLSETAIESSPSSILKDKMIIIALEMMHSSLAQKLTIADIAAKFYMSSDGFIRKFKRCTSETPYTYLKNLRVRTALMLKAQGVTTDSAAEMCGYSDSSALLHAISSNKNELNLW